MTVKSRLLEILEKQKGETLSGEKLAEELHCTRAAIWKAVKSLREEGYLRRFISECIRKSILRIVQRKP